MMQAAILTIQSHLGWRKDGRDIWTEMEGQMNRTAGEREIRFSNEIEKNDVNNYVIITCSVI